MWYKERLKSRVNCVEGDRLRLTMRRTMHNITMNRRPINTTEGNSSVASYADVRNEFKHSVGPYSLEVSEPRLGG